MGKLTEYVLYSCLNETFLTLQDIKLIKQLDALQCRKLLRGRCRLLEPCNSGLPWSCFSLLTLRPYCDVARPAHDASARVCFPSLTEHITKDYSAVQSAYSVNQEAFSWTLE